MCTKFELGALLLLDAGGSGITPLRFSSMLPYKFTHRLSGQVSRGGHSYTLCTTGRDQGQDLGQAVKPKIGSSQEV